jgi:hypothetical protein
VGEAARASLISSESVDGRHLLHFERSAETRARLEQIVRAERDCCSFLSLTLEERGPELVLTIEAPAAGKAIADGLAAAFTGALA